MSSVGDLPLRTSRPLTWRNGIWNRVLGIWPELFGIMLFRAF